MQQILIIEDEESLARLLQIGLKQPNREIIWAKSAAEAFQTIQTHDLDLIVSDIGLPDQSGLEILEFVKVRSPSLPFIMMTAYGSIDSALKAMKSGAYDYLQKPFEPEQLEFVITRALRETKLARDYERLKQHLAQEYDFSNLLGSSKAMKQIFDRIRKAAGTKSTVLIMGESGTGKELIARAIHFNSPRKNEAFVTVDCASIPSNLLESELFGHVKGAFTGADQTKTGLCEEADGGSLFLDEIGELPLDLQSKLLRLLQEQTIRRVGDTKEKKIDIRVIAATNRNLEQESKEKRFREDLFYRLNVVPLVPPALRDRKEDIPILTQHFIKKYAEAYHRDIKRISPDVLQRFQLFEWPGNIRQLENVIEQMVVMTEGQEINAETLPPALTDSQSLDHMKMIKSEWDLKKALQQVQHYTEEFMIRRALQETQKNKTKAAELLGISRRSLITKVQDYKIEAIEDNDE